MRHKARPEEWILLIWGSVTLSVIAIVSEPNLIDGISYYKTSIGIILFSIISPLLIYKLIPFFQVKSVVKCLISLAIFLSIILIKDDNIYRDFFGAPGRSNGVFNVINFISLILFGLFIRKFFRIEVIYQTLSFLTLAISSISIILTYLNIGSGTPLASWNFSNGDFRENTDLVAPLIAMGFVAEVCLIKKSSNFLRIFNLLPTTIFLYKLGLLQSLVSIGLGLSVLFVFNALPKLKVQLIPWAIIFGYILGLWLVATKLLQSDPSVQERKEIIFTFFDLSKFLTLLPENIDGVSDFTQSYNSNQILDDFHNVFLQAFFSFGILCGLFFVYVAMKPFWIRSVDFRDKISFVAVYSTFFTSLLIGISSPNYVYFGAVLIGFSLGDKSSLTEKAYVSRESFRKIVTGIVLISAVILVYSQSSDYLLRREISSLTSSLPLVAGNLESSQRLSTLISRMPDAGYRYLIGRNFYIVDKCAEGDAVLNQMIKTNPQESRIKYLRSLRDDCVSP